MGIRDAKDIYSSSADAYTTNNDDITVSDINVMGDINTTDTGQYLFQCVKCGSVKNKFKQGTIIDDIYYDIYCPKCNASTLHLYIGYKNVDYSLYDSFLDERYFS